MRPPGFPLKTKKGGNLFSTDYYSYCDRNSHCWRVGSSDINRSYAGCFQCRPLGNIAKIHVNDEAFTSVAPNQPLTHLLDPIRCLASNRMNAFLGLVGVNPMHDTMCSNKAPNCLVFYSVSLTPKLRKKLTGFHHDHCGLNTAIPCRRSSFRFCSMN